MIFSSADRKAPYTDPTLLVTFNPILSEFRADWTQYRETIGDDLGAVIDSWLNGPERFNIALDGYNCFFLEDNFGDYRSGTWVERVEGGRGIDAQLREHATKVLRRLGALAGM